ncbi:unnamed protein product [Plutella xylostella]|uniref:(diamondback moth) hypothetical protein n=1 Tax=Plutella xylostella TaxID=51655 RepID=A0A8S4FCY9_PLUXY|nr:unnamed protein product [Plutella xylostella]
MVFCYKAAAEGGRKSAASTSRGSPRRRSPVGKGQTSLSELISSFNYEEEYPLSMLEIPERDWRLLGALAKKRDLESEQDRLAEEFHRLWQTEKEERQKIEKQTSYQYRRYISAKREEERRWAERRRLEQALEEQVRTGQLVSHIRHKERRSAGVLAEQDDKKIADLIEKATELDARAALAAERRTRLEAAERYRRDLELDGIRRRMEAARRRKMQMMRDASETAKLIEKVTEVDGLEAAEQHRRDLELDGIRRRMDAARRKKTEMMKDASEIADLIGTVTEMDGREAAERYRRDLELDGIRRRMEVARRKKMQMMRDTSQRLALTNALNTWEATILRQQTLAMEATTQAHHAARAAITDARTTNVLRAKERKKRRARKVASVTRMLRDAVKAGYY